MEGLFCTLNAYMALNFFHLSWFLELISLHLLYTCIPDTSMFVLRFYHGEIGSGCRMFFW
jgi:hypothetical protein